MAADRAVGTGVADTAVGRAVGTAVADTEGAAAEAVLGQSAALAEEAAGPAARESGSALFRS